MPNTTREPKDKPDGEKDERLAGIVAMLDGAYSEVTIRGYVSDYRRFKAWCAQIEQSPLPASPETVAAFVDAAAETYGAATIRRRVTAIACFHRMAGYEEPTRAQIVRLALRRMHRLKGQRHRQKLGMRARLKDELLAACRDDLRGVRDRALLMVGYDTLCRRAELVALRAEDLGALPGGAACILVRRSKADPLGQGRLAYLSPDTRISVETWLAAAGIAEGPLFRSVRHATIGEHSLHPYTVTRSVKELAARAGLDPAVVYQLSGHSFRIGAALDMAEQGIDLLPIMHAGGWSSPEMVFRYTNQVDVTRSGSAQLHERMRRQPAASHAARGDAAASGR